MEGWVQGEPRECKSATKYVGIEVIVPKAEYLELKKKGDTITIEPREFSKEELAEFERQYQEHLKENEKEYQEEKQNE